MRSFIRTYFYVKIYCIKNVMQIIMLMDEEAEVSNCIKEKSITEKKKVNTNRIE